MERIGQYYDILLMEQSREVLRQHTTLAVSLVESLGFLLSWEVSQPPPYAQKISPLLSCPARSSKKPLLIRGSEFEIRYFDKKEAIVLICDSIGRSEILG